MEAQQRQLYQKSVRRQLAALCLGTGQQGFS
jgi:hypothetical protein